VVVAVALLGRLPVIQFEERDDPPICRHALWNQGFQTVAVGATGRYPTDLAST